MIEMTDPYQRRESVMATTKAPAAKKTATKKTPAKAAPPAEEMVTTLCVRLA